jgi:glutamine amidotransferase
MTRGGEEVGILNLEMGNLRSVSNAVHSLGFDHRLIDRAADIDGVSRLIIPGVGAFHTAMRRMETGGVTKAVRDFAATGRPVLGLCLGMQLLAERGDEGEPTRGLAFVPARVARLDPSRVAAIPHVGWNTVRITRPHPVFAGVKEGVDFYFVHSYRCVMDEDRDTLAVTDCGEEFPSVIGRANVLGFQFHPEKSQSNGLRLLENFCEWDGRC